MTILTPQGGEKTTARRDIEGPIGMNGELLVGEEGEKTVVIGTRKL